MDKKKRKVILQTLFLLFLVVGSYWVIKHNDGRSPFEKPNERVWENEGMVFGTTYHISYQFRRDLHNDIRQAMQEVDGALSMFNAESALTQINNGSTDASNLLVQDVLTLALEVSKDTHGSFDVTVAPLVNAWGFGFKNGQLPDSTQVDSILQFVGYESIHLEGNRLTKDDSRTILDCSAIAKGYGCDHVARLMERMGVKNYMIEIGGEVVCHGKNRKGKAWSIGVCRPVEDGNEGNEAVLQLTDRAMATSGNYRNYYVTEDGRKLAHTIDPHSGYPVQHSILSSTVIAPTCAQADAYATSFMVMGVDSAMAFANRHPEMEAFIIYADEKGEMHDLYTKGLEKYLK